MHTLIRINIAWRSFFFAHGDFGVQGVLNGSACKYNLLGGDRFYISLCVQAESEVSALLFVE